MSQLLVLHSITLTTWQERFDFLALAAFSPSSKHNCHISILFYDSKAFFFHQGAKALFFSLETQRFVSATFARAASLLCTAQVAFENEEQVSGLAAVVVSITVTRVVMVNCECLHAFGGWQQLSMCMVNVIASRIQILTNNSKIK